MPSLLSSGSVGVGTGGRDRAERLEEVAAGAIPNVKTIADDRKPHRVAAVQELAVFDGLHAEVGWDRGRAAAVPAGAVTRFWVDRHVIWSAGARSLAAARRLRRKRNPPCAWRRDPAPLSATASGGIR